MSYLNYIQNPKAFVLKKWTHQILEGHYIPKQGFIERLGMALSEEDLHEFGKLMTSVYEKGYLQAVKSTREQFEKLGYKIEVVLPDTPKIE